MIKDRDARDAIETLTEEFENLESNLKDCEQANEELHAEIKQLKYIIDDLKQQVQDLETALAEAYLTDESGTDTGKDSIQAGSRSDVPNPADDKRAE